MAFLRRQVHGPLCTESDAAGIDLDLTLSSGLGCSAGGPWPWREFISSNTHKNRYRLCCPDGCFASWRGNLRRGCRREEDGQPTRQLVRLHLRQRCDRHCVIFTHLSRIRPSFFRRSASCQDIVSDTYQQYPECCIDSIILLVIYVAGATSTSLHAPRSENRANHLVTSITLPTTCKVHETNKQRYAAASFAFSGQAVPLNQRYCIV